jgi:hypothetical protein
MYNMMAMPYARPRGNRFDRSKIAVSGDCVKINVQRGQIEYEWEHLLKKLQARAPDIYEVKKDLLRPASHPLFEIVPSGFEDWERV